MAKLRVLLACSECGHQTSQWAGRCPGCGAWGTIAEQPGAAPRGATGSRRAATVETLGGPTEPEPRVSTGFPGVDRVLGGGLVPASVVLLAGEPGIGKSTLLLQVMARLSAAGLTCLYASGEESRGQVAARARRLGLGGDAISFVPGRELPDVVDAARREQPFVLAVDSIQTLRDPEAQTQPGGTSQVRGCADALVGLAKAEGVTVLLAGHVTKDGDLAGPRTLEHAVDAVLTFDGDPASGLRVLSGGKNRFGPEGEVAWFEMEGGGLVETDPSDHLAPGSAEPGAATALLAAGRRALAVEVQALVVSTDGGPARRQASGLDVRRFSLVAAVLDRAAGIPLVRAELYGAAAGGLRIDDPASDLAVAAALASAATGRPVPVGLAFAGEVALTGRVRASPGLSQRLAAARAAGFGRVVVGGVAGREAAGGRSDPPEGVDVVRVRHVREALWWAVGAQADRPRAAATGRAARSPVGAAARK
jgi:DNA repair protein RadA/Sms